LVVARPPPDRRDAGARSAAVGGWHLDVLVAAGSAVEGSAAGVCSHRLVRCRLDRGGGTGRLGRAGPAAGRRPALCRAVLRGGAAAASRWTPCGAFKCLAATRNEVERSAPPRTLPVYPG